MRKPTMVVTGSAMALAAGLVLAPVVSIPSAEAASGYKLMRLGNGQVVRWNPCQSAITYKVNVRFAGNAKDRRKALREAKAAFGKLGKFTGMKFGYTGTTKRIPTGSKWYTKHNSRAEIVVAYVKRSGKYRSNLLGRNAWGTGGSVHLKWQGGNNRTRAAIVRGFVVMDADKVKRIRKGFARGPTRGNLLLHELGHVVGLNHVGSQYQLMYRKVSKRTPNGYARGDRAGLRKVGRPAGCISVPSYRLR